ncbi:MAG: glycoside hydrolase family 99-like domain-containing protein [Lentisphaeria bacterium]|nr:glycoside hydrolase family 99-like domain-containing protein [Lentisphaeria bacterium]
MFPRALLAIGMAAVGTAAAAAVLQEWRFTAEAGPGDWGSRANHIGDLRVEDGCLNGRILDWDPFLTSPPFEMTVTPWQVVEIKMKTDCGGSGQLYYTNTTETQYGGFSPGKAVAFPVVGDNLWHVLRILPFWQAEGKVILIRVDLPTPAPQDKGRLGFAIEWVRIVEEPAPAATAGQPTWDLGADPDGWTVEGGTAATPVGGEWRLRAAEDRNLLIGSPLLRFDAGTAGEWVTVEMALDRGRTAALSWASAAAGKRASKTFPVRGDGRLRTYNVEVAADPAWNGDILLLELRPSDEPGATVRLKRIAVSQEPAGPPDVEVLSARLANAVNRAGQVLPFTLAVRNLGGETVRGLRLERVVLPPGLAMVTAPEQRVFEEFECLETASLSVELRAERPVEGEFALYLSGPGAPADPFRGRVRVDASLDLPRAEYVPEPRPLESDYEIGALYFPGWPSIDRWARIWPTAPERKPVLGWYDEGNPECVDWQIKWAVENGMRFFLVDWYWNKGSQHLDHWVKAYRKARYRPYLKWAMMWANHNQAGSHSEEDQREVTRFWIENYFGMPEYYRIEDMPLVMIWSPANMNRDLDGKGGVARLLEISNEMAREAGYKGIWFVAMKWPEASTEAKDIQWLADAGFHMTSIYHYMHHGGKAENPKYFPFDLVAESSAPFWRARHATGILPFLPNLSTGWDARPWHGDRATVIHGRSVPLFRRICEDAKAFADETGVRRLVLAPLNEWGEGSYAEPCAEFGFGMYETVRDVFCRRPAGGWPLNYAPADVGLGPYDLPRPEAPTLDAWDFDQGAQGWSAMMGIADFGARDGSLYFRCRGGDPALHVRLDALRARRYAAVTVRIKAGPTAPPEQMLQLFWTIGSGSATEETSVRAPFPVDGAYHDIVLPVAENPRWRGRITSLRLDPGSTPGLECSIDAIRMLPVQP